MTAIKVLSLDDETILIGINVGSSSLLLDISDESIVLFLLEF